MIHEIKRTYDSPRCDVNPLMEEGIICLSPSSENIIDDPVLSEYEW